MQKYTKVKVIRVTDFQHKTLQKMKELNVDVGKFIRDVISEKIQREKIELLKPKKEYCPF